MNKLGFGFLRLPLKEDRSIDDPLLAQMVDTFLALGGTYFDTAYTYLEGRSEEALRKALVQRHPRHSYRLADKLPGWLVSAPEDCERYFQEQLNRCGVDWFDVYLIHWLNPENYEIALKYGEFDFLQQLKADGRAKEIGFSYHGDAALLDRILHAHPQVDVVQLQINYLDWDDPAIEAGKCYQVARRHGKKILVMEPVKGGTLANLPESAATLLEDAVPGRSPAAWALGFAQSLEGVSVVLSGMNTLEQIQENLQDFPPMQPAQRSLLRRVTDILNGSIAIPCTGCGYCHSHCPMEIPIADFFAMYNSYARHPGELWKMQPVYQALAQDRAPASDCISCGACQHNCPQHIPIPKWLPKVAEVME